MKQLFFNFIQDYKKEFGGSLLVGKRKSKRPLSTKHPLHLILKSSHKGLFNPKNISLDQLIRSQCKKFGIKLYDLAINWSHIHMLVKIQDREDYIRFIKSLTSLISMKIQKVKPELKDIFTLRPFTRIVSWGRDFKRALEYQVLNQLEAFGFIRREKKKAKPKLKGISGQRIRVTEAVKAHYSVTKFWQMWPWL